MYEKLTNNQLLNLLIHLKSNHKALEDILNELTIRKHLNALEETYIDEILDSYNDNKQLYEIFKDERYADKMFAYEAEFFKVTYWAYDVLADEDTKTYRLHRSKMKGRITS